FGSLKAGPGRGSASLRFVGSDVRLRDDTEREMHVALGVRSPGLGDADYPTSLVMQAIVGSWDKSLGSNKNMFSKVSHQAGPFELANSYASFCEAYSDVGLWGAYIVSENLSGIDDLIWFLQKDWARLTVSPTEGDVHIARNKVCAAIHHSLGSATSAVADDIGRQITATGGRLSPREFGALVDRVTWKDVSRVAGEYLWDQEVAVVGIGPVEGVTDFVRYGARPCKPFLTARLRFLATSPCADRLSVCSYPALFFACKI
ncbi:MAG: Metalloenzyme, LuxS/M16 peptidase-like protein, partial [Olpidium bornovanus]